MGLKENMEKPARPVILYEMIPPKAGNAEEWETNLASIRELAGKVDGINFPEIREESRQGVRRTRLPERIEPRVFARTIQQKYDMDTVINRVTVHEILPEQQRWMKETASWKAAEKSITQACKILSDVFDNLPPHPPALGINVEQIISRNFKPSLLLAKLTGFYHQLLQARYASSGGSLQTASLPCPLAEQSTGHWN